MAVRQIPAVFKTSDGAEFEKEDRAKAHQKKLDALSSYEEARRALAHACTKAMTTADGHLFDGGTYYYITGWPRPVVRELYCTGWYTQEFQMQPNGNLALVQRWEGNGHRDYVIHQISDLYKSKAAAREAWKVEMLKVIAEMHEDIEKHAST